MRWRYLLILLAAAAGNLIASVLSDEDAGQTKEFNLPTQTNYGTIDNRWCSSAVSPVRQKTHDADILADVSSVMVCKDFFLLTARGGSLLSPEGPSGRPIAPDLSDLRPGSRLIVAP